MDGWLEDNPPFLLGETVTFQGRTVKLQVGTPLKTNMTLENPRLPIGNILSNGGYWWIFQPVMLVFAGVEASFTDEPILQ